MRKRVFLPAFGIWLLPLGFAIVNGAFRDFVLEPNLGEEAAYILSTTTLASAVFVAALLFIATGRRTYSHGELLTIGLTWVLLTIVFESLFGHHIMGRSGRELLADYDVSRGRLFALVLLAELAAPFLAGFARKLADRAEHYRA